MKDSRKMYDVVIAGAGPAGSSAAIRLAAAGLRVLLVEQKKFPRQKLCGEFISPECLVHFRDLGVDAAITADGGKKIRQTIFFARNGKSIAIDNHWFGDEDASAIGLSRAALDQRLLDRARQTGADIIEQATASGLIVENSRVKGLILKAQRMPEARICATIAVDATGRNRSLVRHLDKKDSLHTPAEYVAFKAHIRGSDLASGACEIYIYKGGYGGCNRVEGDLFNLCFIVSAEQTKRHGSDPERVMREVLYKNKRAAEVLANARIASDWLAVPITRFGRGDVSPAEGLISIGDAAAFIDPFTGSGILLALESGKLAAEAIVNGLKLGADPADICAKYRLAHMKAFDLRMRVCGFLRYASFMPLAAEMTISLLSMSRLLQRNVARATHGNPINSA